MRGLRRTALRAAERACDQALRTNPAWQAEAQRLHGTLAWLSGDRASARRRWQAGFKTAGEMPHRNSRAAGRSEVGHGRHLNDVHSSSAVPSYC